MNRKGLWVMVFGGKDLEWVLSVSCDDITLREVAAERAFWLNNGFRTRLVSERQGVIETLERQGWHVNPNGGPL